MSRAGAGQERRSRVEAREEQRQVLGWSRSRVGAAARQKQKQGRIK